MGLTVDEGIVVVVTVVFAGSNEIDFTVTSFGIGDLARKAQAEKKAADSPTAEICV